MRTPLTINDRLAGLKARKTPQKARRYRLKSAPLGQPLPGIDLDKSLQLADALEDIAIAWKLQTRDAKR